MYHLVGKHTILACTRAAKGKHMQTVVARFRWLVRTQQLALGKMSSTKVNAFISYQVEIFSHQESSMQRCSDLEERYVITWY